jgi:hypothetical protein
MLGGQREPLLFAQERAVTIGLHSALDKPLLIERSAQLNSRRHLSTADHSRAASLARSSPVDTPPDIRAAPTAEDPDLDTHVDCSRPVAVHA